MSPIPGGSAYTFAREVGHGYYTVTRRTFQSMPAGELATVAFELDRFLREVRAEPPPTDDVVALQKRNRKIQRLNAALLTLRTFRQQRRGA